MQPASRPSRPVVVVGAGPAGLMAAETLAAGGAAVTVLDRMPSPGRKFLMAGRGGLNLTHSTPMPGFLDSYGPASDRLAPAIQAFPPAALAAWCEALGQPVFTGSSGRVFPTALKASPLLRAWLRRLQSDGVQLRPRAEWTGWHDGRVHLADGDTLPADAVLLATGGASWPRLGADGLWTSRLPGIDIAPLRPSNCGFAVAWSDIFRTRHAGTPLKRIALRFQGQVLRGEAVVTEAGIEGGAVYALSARLRDAIAAAGPTTLAIDLRPDLDDAALAARLAAPRRGQSLSTWLRKTLALPPVAIGLLQEAMHAGAAPHLADRDLPRLVRACPLTLLAPFGLDRAISTAGGIAWHELDDRLMLRRHPGLFAAGEMLDWEAPTGGWLLQACFSTGRAAAQGALAWLADPS